MSIKVDLGKIFFLILFFALSIMAATAGTLKGTIVDKQTKEPLTGATVQVAGTTLGAVADIDGRYTLELNNGNYTLTVKYVGYKDITLEAVRVKGETRLDLEMESDAQALGEVSVTARKNLEGERALQLERQKATLAVENLGAKEMSLKGIGNVQEGVKKITGISVASAGQLIVRGLGDRYSTTTLNGLPIASPNPDNKLIPLNLFPASTVQNITVSKVYDAEAYADYSGAHIDISTKENVSDDFLNLGISTGGKFQTLGKYAYQMDCDGSLFTTPKLADNIKDMSRTEFGQYVLNNNPFKTNFNVNKKTSIPELGGNLGYGRNFAIGSQTLSVLASVSAASEHQTMTDAFYKTINTSGTPNDDFSYDSYTDEMKLTALGYVGYTLRRNDRIGYTFFYSRQATDTYQRREGKDYEGYELVGSNNTTHIYTLQNHQLNGLHNFGENDSWQLTWGTSWGTTGSNEPDRRQVMFVKSGGKLNFFKLNQQETSRYFGELNEDEWNGNLGLKWKWNDRNHVKVGVNYKNKQRDYEGIRFYYNLHGLGEDHIEDIYQMDGLLNQENISNGSIVLSRYMYPYEAYKAENRIIAGYATTDFYPMESLLVNVGVRYEMSRQSVKYATDGSEKYAKTRNIDKNDLFPTLNLKYSITPESSLRFAASRTVTRPSFIEMAPFRYQESYGSASIRGNADLQNGYNLNFDLRYELFKGNGDMLSVTGYYKYLDSPIERTQTLSGGDAVHSFNNAENGMAAGMELEFRKALLRDLKVGGNVSYMYTNVKLPEAGVYTNKERSLQGASPILVNADVTYSPRWGEDRQLSMALLYNLQGSRIHSVGISGLGDVEQEALHMLNFNAAYSFNRHFSMKLQVSDLLNRAVNFKQEIPTTGEKITVESYKPGSSFEIGASFSF